MAASRWHRMRSVPPPPFNSKHLVSTHEQKCLYGKCGIQLHTPRNSPRTSPTGVWGKRQADVRTSRVAYRRLWMSSGPSWPCHGRASGNTNWGFHLHMRESLWRWDFSMELSHSIEAIFVYNTHTHTHIYIPLDALGCEEWTSWLCGHHSSPKGAQLRADLGCLWFSHRRKGELVSEHMTSPALQDAAEKARFTLTASRELYGGFHD